jgi:hypothetical protein
MARSFRVDYTKGISSVVEPRLLGDGYAVFIDNADMTAFAASSYRSPVYRQDAPAGTVHIFEYRGKWHFSVDHRHWAAEYVGKQERLYYTGSGYSPTAPKRAMKVIDGVEALLGTARPKCAVTVSTDVIAYPAGLTVDINPTGSALPDGSVTYRLGYRTKDGLIPAGPGTTVAITKGQSPVLKWSTTTLTDVISVVIYGRTSGKEQILDEVAPDVTQFVDDGSLSPSGEYAANLDQTDVFFYFHTFLRNVNGHIDESGPSPLSPRVDQGKVCKITRNPDLEGLFDGASVVTGAPAYKTVLTHNIIGSALRAVGSRRILTTNIDHGLSLGDEVGIVPANGSIDPNLSKHVYKISTFTSDLPAPTITAFGAGSAATPVWATGTALTAQVVAFRGAGWDLIRTGLSGIGAPAESLPSVSAAWTTTAGVNALLQWSYPSGDADGFHVYVNGKLVAQLPPEVLYLEFNSLATSLPSAAPPTVNTSRTRAFYIAEDASILWDSSDSMINLMPWGWMAKAPETKVVKVAHGLAKDDLLSFSGYLELNGIHPVSRVGTPDEFYVKVLTQFDDATSSTRVYKMANPDFQFVDKWALYVQRGATGGVALQQGVYPISQTEVIDYKPVQGLSVTCDSSYTAATTEGDVQVVFNPPPLGMRFPTLHNGVLWAIVDNSVIWTPVNRPDAWPNACRRNFPFPPVGLASYGPAMVVLLPNGVGRFDGTDPFNVSFTMTGARDGCNAPNSIQHTAAGLMYLSPRGLMAFQLELNTSVPITDGKIEPSLFSAASASVRWPTWWIPTRSTAGWAKCTRGLPAADGLQQERQIDETLPMRGVLEDVRSFYWRGKYYLYFTGDTFGRHGTLVVDTTRRNEGGYPVFHLGLRPEHAHVTDRDQAFLLLRQYGPHLIV